MVTLKSLLFVMLLLLLGLMLPGAVAAQNAKEETAIQIGTPDHLHLGDRVTLQAVLGDSQGRPISGATIYFSAHAAFLSGSGEMVVAQAVTNENGQAVAGFENQMAGRLELRADFRGDDHYSPSGATAEIPVEGDAQLYVPQVGVQIPGLNQPPPVPAAASLGRPMIGMTQDVSNLWPSMSGWPIALVLLTVWSLYVLVVVLIFRIAAPARRNRGFNVETGRFE
ncbi:MAG: Ig-like domain-containing protein [Rudaea sp.]